jgi:ferritin-like metal-binding protein YciE
MADPTIGNLKLAQYLNEAYGKEKELETALQAHIQMTTAKPYKKRLQDHLKETKAHAREVERRIKKLGGKAEVAPAPGPELITEAAAAVTSAASKAVAAAQGPLHAIRGTGEAEKMLKNAKTEYHNEFEEIAGYTAIEALAEELGDKETAKLARQIRRDEERMAKFLERQIPQLVKAVAREEIPSAERKKPRRSSSRRSSSASSTRKSSARKSTSRKSSAQGSSRKGSTRKASSRSASSRSSSSRSGSTRKASSRSGSTRRKSSSRS